MKKFIHAAEDVDLTAEEMLSEMISTVKDNFNFAIDGIEKIAADGDVENALNHATTLNEMIDGAVGEIAEDIAQ